MTCPSLLLQVETKENKMLMYGNRLVKGSILKIKKKKIEGSIKYLSQYKFRKPHMLTRHLGSINIVISYVE